MQNKNKKHKERIFNAILYGLAGLVGIIFTVNIVGGLIDGDLFQGSLLSIFNRIGLTSFEEQDPDIGIDYVYLRKTANPTEELPYYKYSTTVVVRNYGEDLRDGAVLISAGNGQKSAFVRNTLDGLSLEKGQTFIFDDYEILMSDKFNYGRMEFQLELKGQEDGDEDNDLKAVEIWEEPVDLEDFYIESVDMDGAFALSYSHENSEGMVLEICVLKNFEGAYDLDLKYAEVDTAGDVYSYYKAKSWGEFFSDVSADCGPLGEAFVGGGLEEDADYTLYLRALDAETMNENFLAVSNLIHLPAQKTVNRAEFVKLFTEYADIDLYTDGKHYFEDVDTDQWYAPYVQTMFNYGLLYDSMDFIFGPDEAVLRRDVLEPLLNYFDVDLIVDEGAPHFYDVGKDDEDFFFAEALHSSGEAKAIGIHLYPDKKASRQFLKYVIDEFMEAQN